MAEGINVRISGKLRRFILEQTSPTGLYESASEYVRDLIRRDYQRQEERKWCWLMDQIRPGLEADESEFVQLDAEEIIKAVRDVNAGKSALDAEIVQKVVAQVSSTRNQDHPVEKLTGRELEVLALVAKGYTNKAIGVQLGISDRTVQGHLAHIFSKLQSASRTEAVMRAVSLGWLPSDLGDIE